MLEDFSDKNFSPLAMLWYGAPSGILNPHAHRNFALPIVFLRARMPRAVPLAGFIIVKVHEIKKEHRFGDALVRCTFRDSEPPRAP